MHLLSPWFAGLLVLGALPVLIHLHGRRRAKVRKLPTLLLLQASHRRVAQRTRLRHLLLLLLRVLVMVALPLVLAKPYVETTSDLPAQISAAQSAVLVLDDSLSLRGQKEAGRGGPLLAEAKRQATRLVGALPPGAQAALVLGSRGGAAPVPELTADRARLFSAISAVQPSFRGTDLPTALKRAAQILHTVGTAQRRVYLITDAAVHAIEAGMQPPTDVEVAVIDVSEGKPRPNRAVVDVRADAALSLGPRAVRVTAEVANHGDMPVKELPITLLVDGRAVAKGLLDLPARGHAVKRFVHILQPPPDAATEGTGAPPPPTSPPGLHHVSVRLDPDLLPEDDERHLRVEVQRTLRVLILDGDPRTLRRDDEAFYLEMALRPGEREDTGIQVTTQPLDEATPTLGDLDAVFLVNAKAEEAQRLLAPLKAYVQKGGGLFIALGDNVDVDAYNGALGELLPQPLAVVKTTGPVARSSRESASESSGESAPSGPGEHLGRIDRRHPILVPFGVGRASESLLSARFDRYFLLKPTPRSAAEGATVVLSFESGAPALVERTLGRGKVLLFTSTLDRDWNSLPIQPAFLPLLQQAVRHLSREPLRETEQPTLIGQPRDIRLQSGDTRVEVTLPSGQKRLFDRLSGRQVLSFLHTVEPGLYRVAAGGDTGLLRPRPSEYFVANIDPLETDLQAAPQQRVQQLTRPLAQRTPAVGQGSAPRRRVELWHSLGALLLVFLVGEALLLRQR